MHISSYLFLSIYIYIYLWTSTYLYRVAFTHVHTKDHSGTTQAPAKSLSCTWVLRPSQPVYWGLRWYLDPPLRIQGAVVFLIIFQQPAPVLAQLKEFGPQLSTGRMQCIQNQMNLANLTKVFVLRLRFTCVSIIINAWDNYSHNK